MSNPLHRLAALPVPAVARRPDILFAIGLAGIVAMLIVPMPGFVLDGLIAVNMAFAVTLLMVALFSSRALDLSSFPTLLLVTTMFRLGLNVSTTRGILAHADAGRMVAAFGKVVLSGDVVVGFVVFLVITLVQLLVIAKGAERVAEVAARFTLDALPGKQMAIDASARAGAFDEEEAERRRGELARESQLFGNMDGAMKFVKGDAIAGLVITAINLIAGFSIGVGRLGFELDEALDVYAVLTVGDGLVSQVSALLVTVTAAILVTRVQGGAEGHNVGRTIGSELGRSPTALLVAGGLMLALALVPGLPALPFLLAASAAGAAAMSKRIFNARAAPAPFEAVLEHRKSAAEAQVSMADRLAPAVVPLGLDLDPELSVALGFGEDEDSSPELLTERLPQLRDALYIQTGVAIPPVRVRTFVGSLPAGTFVLRVKDVPLLTQAIPLGCELALAAPGELARLAVKGQPIEHPVTGEELTWIPAEQRPVVAAAGIGVWNAAGMIALWAAAVLRREVGELLGLQEVGELIERLRAAYPGLVSEVIPKVVSLPQLLEVLRRLVDEQVCIRDLKSIVEALGAYGTVSDDTVYLTEKARGALGRQLAHAHAMSDGRLPAVMVDPIIEDMVDDGITRVDGGHVLALEPELAQEIIEGARAALKPMMEAGLRPVLLSRAGVRRYVKKLLEADLPEVVVLSYEELPRTLTVQPIGRLLPAA